MLCGIGMVQGAPVVLTGVTTHKFVKSIVSDAPYLTGYVRMGTGVDKFSRQIHDIRLSQLVINMQRGQGVTVRGVGMGLKETIIADGGYTVKAEADTEFMPFLGGFIWDTLTAGPVTLTLAFLEHTIRLTAFIEMDDQLCTLSA